MKTTSRYLAIMTLIALFIACEKENLLIVPDVHITSQQHSIYDFHEFEISGNFIVFTRFGEQAQLQIEANDNLHSLIEVEQKNGKLSLDLKDNTSFYDGRVVLNVYLTVKDLHTISAVGTSEINLENLWQANNVEIELEGSSRLVGALSCNELSVRLRGASKLDLEGGVGHLDIKVNGASQLNGFTFETNELEAELNGNSEISVTVHDQLDVTASGASTVFYKGNGIIKKQNLSGGSQIVKVP